MNGGDGGSTACRPPSQPLRRAQPRFLRAGLPGFFVWRRRAWLCNEAHPGPGQRAYRELAYAMAASLLLRAAMLLFIDNAEPRYTLEFFPVFFVWIGALFAEPRTLREA